MIAVKADAMTEDSLTIAYFLSRDNMKAVNALGYKSFRDAFDEIGIILNQKPSTIKNMRDEFDSFFENGRVGWYQRELSNSRKEVYDKYKNVSDEELLKKVLYIINKYKE